MTALVVLLSSGMRILTATTTGQRAAIGLVGGLDLDIDAFGSDPVPTELETELSMDALSSSNTISKIRRDSWGSIPLPAWSCSFPTPLFINPNRHSFLMRLSRVRGRASVPSLVSSASCPTFDNYADTFSPTGLTSFGKI